MPYARSRRSEAPAPPPDLAALAAKAEGTRLLAEEHLAAAERLLDAARQGSGLPGGLDRRQVALLLHGLRQVGASQAMTAAELRRLSLESVLNDMERGALEAGGFRQGAAAAAGGRHRHRRDRRPGRNDAPLFGIPGGKATVATVGLAASLVAGTVGTGAYSDLAHFTQVPAAHHAASSLPVLSPAVAIPLASPLQRTPYEGKHRRAQQGADAKTATLAPQLAPPVVVVDPPASLVPSAQPSASAYGHVNLQTFQVSVGALQPGQVTFFAQGGPVRWTASSPSSDIVIATDPQGDGAQQVSGILGDGQSLTLYLKIVPGSFAGAGDVTISDGSQSQDVHVVWVAVPGLLG